MNTLNEYNLVNTHSTPPLMKYDTDRPQPYEVDFVNSLQKNVATGYGRSIRREQEPVRTTKSTWQFNDVGVWKDFDRMDQDLIEKEFKKYESGGQASTFTTHFIGRPETYEINFVMGTQTNKSTGTSKPIRR